VTLVVVAELVASVSQTVHTFTYLEGGGSGCGGGDSGENVRKRGAL
jgi:hypothetical protein